MPSIAARSQALKWIATEGIEPAFITFSYMLIAKDRGITVDEARERARKRREGAYFDDD